MTNIIIAKLNSIHFKIVFNLSELHKILINWNVNCTKFAQVNCTNCPCYFILTHFTSNHANLVQIIRAIIFRHKSFWNDEFATRRKQEIIASSTFPTNKRKVSPIVRECHTWRACRSHIWFSIKNLTAAK